MGLGSILSYLILYSGRVVFFPCKVVGELPLFDIATTARRPCSAWHCWSAYVAAFVVACLLAPVLRGRWPDSPLFNGLLLTSASTTIVFVFSFLADNSSVYDPYWVLAPLHLAFVWKAQAPGGFWFYEPRETVCIVLLWAWALRFTIMVPWEGWKRGLVHEDWRYDQIRGQLAQTTAMLYWQVSLVSLHLTPSLLVYCALCPLGRVVLQGSVAPPLCALDGGAALLAASGIALEAIADQQLRSWQRAHPAARTACRQGPWRFSRHPNYCGECIFWSGLLLFAVAADALRAEPWLAAGAALMWAFFRVASVPLMDARSLSRRSDYVQVMASTSALLLMPPGYRLGAFRAVDAKPLAGGTASGLGKERVE
jgi:steroid 5-alpha reductase family enzyme